LQEAEKRGKKLFLYTGPQPQAKANAAVLVGDGVLAGSRLLAAVEQDDHRLVLARTANS